MDNPTTLEDWELLAQITQAFRSFADMMMDQVDVHRAQGALLCRLGQQDGMTQSEIADQLRVQGATITNMLQRMEEAGLVVRRRDPDDNRLVRVYLTEVGREKERFAAEQFMKLEGTVFGGFSESERILLRRLFRQMLENMGEKEG